MDSSDEELLNSFANQWEQGVVTECSSKKPSSISGDVDKNGGPTKRHLEILLKKFGHKNFRPLQWQVINSVMNNKKDTCAIMSTGYGKSLCFQFPAVYCEGVAIIISPLISLMEDQVLSLTIANIPACILGSSQKSNSETVNEILEHKYSIVYLTPEFATGEYGRDILHKMASKLKVVLITVDEAHCVSSWGHDFRFAYRSLGTLKKIFSNVPMLAVTATATENVRKDIIRVLNLKNPEITCSGFDRPNLYFEVRLKGHNPFQDLKSLMVRRDNQWVFEGPTIIYCIKRKDTEEVCELLELNGIKSASYHAGMPLKKRREAHENFVKDKVSAIIATIAFGMGIDKPDVRNVIHYGTSSSMESYYQEVGRAGRDGLPSTCVVFYNTQDFSSHEYFMGIGDNKDRKRTLFNAMKEYLVTRSCRRKFILSYFEDDAKNPAPKKCCDNCSKLNNPNEEYEGLDDKGMYDYTQDASVFLSVVDVLGGSYGVGLYVLFLKGSKSSKVKEQLRSKPLYGSGAHKSEEWWKAIAEFLEMKQYLVKSNRDGGTYKYFVVGLSKKGHQFLQSRNGEKLVDYPSPNFLKLFKKKQQATGWISSVRGGPSQKETRTGVVEDSSNTELTKERGESKESPENEASDSLYRLLLKCRSEIASKNDCMPYMIASNSALKEMALHKPNSLQELRNLQLDGFTEVKLNNYGQIFVNLISLNYKPSIQKILEENPLANKKFGNSAAITYGMFTAGDTLDEIASKRNLGKSTIMNHLTDGMKMGYPIKMEQLGINEKIRNTVIQTINKVGGSRLLKDIKNACPEEITYDQIIVVLTYVNVREHLKKLGIPYQEFEDFEFKEKAVEQSREEADVEDLILSVCYEMEKHLENEEKTKELTQNTAETEVKASCSSFTEYEPQIKKYKMERNTVLSSPPRDLKDDIPNSPKNDSNNCKIKEQASSENNIQDSIDSKNSTIKAVVTKPNKKKPVWLTKKKI